MLLGRSAPQPLKPRAVLLEDRAQGVYVTERTSTAQLLGVVNHRSQLRELVGGTPRMCEEQKARARRETVSQASQVDVCKIKRRAREFMDAQPLVERLLVLLFLQRHEHFRTKASKAA